MSSPKFQGLHSRESAYELLCRTPDTVARIIGGLHTQGDLRRIDALNTVRDTLLAYLSGDPPDFWKNITKGDLPAIALQIACSHPTYYRGKLPDNVWKRYIASLYSLISILTTRTWSCSNLSSQHKIRLEFIRQRCHVLWKAIDQHKSSLFPTSGIGPPPQGHGNPVPYHIYDLVYGFWQIGQMSSDAGWVDYHTLELFAHSYTRITYFPPDITAHDTSLLMGHIFESDHFRTQGLPQALIQSDGFTERLLDFFHYAIPQYFKSKYFPGVLLWHILKTIAGLVSLQPSEVCKLLMRRTANNRVRLIEHLASACRWQLCQTPNLDASPRSIAESLQRYLVIMSHVVMHFGVIWEGENAIRTLRTYDLFPIYSRALITLRDSLNEDPTLLELAACISVKCLQLYNAPSTSPDAVQEIRLTMRKIFPASFEVIQTAPRPWTRAIQAWLALAMHTGCYTAPSDSLLYSNEYLPGYNHDFKSCGWRDCICSHRQALHPIRICKGCWTTHYCNAQCQKSDWVHGNHREQCHGRFKQSIRR